MGLNPSWVKFGCVVFLPKSYLNQKVTSYDQCDIMGKTGIQWSTRRCDTHEVNILNFLY